MLRSLLLTLVINVWFDGVPTQCTVDTGSQVTVLAQSQAARIGTLKTLDETLLLQGAGGAPFTGKLYWVPNVGTQDLSWDGATVVVLPDGHILHKQCLLGMSLLGQQPLMIDWHGQRILPYREPAR